MTQALRVPEIGEVICWFEGGDPSHKWSPGIVVRADGLVLSVCIIAENLRYQMNRSGVRHMSVVKDVNINIRVQSGGWDYGPIDKLYQRVAELEALLGELQTTLFETEVLRVEAMPEQKQAIVDAKDGDVVALTPAQERALANKNKYLEKVRLKREADEAARTKQKANTSVT